MMPGMADTKRVAGGPPHDGLAIVSADQDTVRGDGASDRPLRADRRSITGVINVKDYGAKGDGVADDIDPILAAVADAAAVTHGAFGAFVYFPKGAYKVTRRIPLPNGVGLRGDAPPGTVIVASDTFHDTYLVGNADPNGNQEFAFLQSLLLDGNKAGGAVCSVAVVDFVSLFINTYLRDVIVQNGSNVGLRIAARNALGPVHLMNVWVLHSGGHNLLIEEEVGNTGGAFGVCANGMWSENCGPDSAAIYLRGLGHSAQWNFWNVHIEQGTADANRTGITIDGVPRVLIDGVQLLRGATPLSAGIRITSSPLNVGIQIRNVENPNLADPVLEDLQNHVTIGAANVTNYMSAGVDIQGGPRFRPGTDPAAVSLVIQDQTGADRVRFDPDGRLTGSSLFGAALEIVSDPVNDRPLLLLNQNKNRVYGWHFVGDDFRLRYFTGGIDIFSFGTDGSVFVYNPMTVQFLLALQSALIGPGDHTTPPTGTHVAGEIVFVKNPVAGGFAGWICVDSGPPAVWKSFGAISP